MNKIKQVFIRITEEQEKELLARTRKYGFTKKADYVRSLIFADLSTEEKINKIYEKVCKNG